MTTFKILSLDGGGIKGLYTLYMLLEFENNYCNGKPISEYFDMISGTSIGGIITLALANNIPLKEIITFFEQNATLIFPNKRPIYQFIRQLLGYKYDNTELKKALTKFFGEKKLRDSKNIVCVPSFNASTYQPIIFKYFGKGKISYRDEDLLLVDVSLATSAAPTFFPMHQINNNHITGWFMDGGIWANDALISITEALNRYVGKGKQYEKYAVLSIGNMYPTYEVTKFSPYYWNITRISKLIVPFVNSSSIC
jgi:patatin-like phospholipase/acyl hydrolase